jgi:Zn-finger nucleic acid-binding protein
MFVGQAGTFRLLGCGRCGGVWLRPDAERAVLSTVVKAALYLADRADESAAVEVNTSQTATCPLCRLPLVRARHDPSGIDLDRCEEHGTWFDRGELQKVSKGAQALREGWKATLRQEEMRRLDEAASQQAALAEEGPARRLFRALGTLLAPADHGGFEDIQDR